MITSKILIVAVQLFYCKNTIVFLKDENFNNFSIYFMIFPLKIAKYSYDLHGSAVASLLNKWFIFVAV